MIVDFLQIIKNRQIANDIWPEIQRIFDCDRNGEE